MGHLSSFVAALDNLGRTNRERAAVVGVSLRTYYDLKKGRLGPMRRLMRHPDLVAALLEDARAGRTNGVHHDETEQVA
jgi:hypothetical protein